MNCAAAHCAAVRRMASTVGGRPSLSSPRRAIRGDSPRVPITKVSAEMRSGVASSRTDTAITLASPVSSCGSMRASAAPDPRSGSRRRKETSTSEVLSTRQAPGLTSSDRTGSHCDPVRLAISASASSAIRAVATALSPKALTMLPASVLCSPEPEGAASSAISRRMGSASMTASARNSWPNVTAPPRTTRPSSIRIRLSAPIRDTSTR